MLKAHEAHALASPNPLSMEEILDPVEALIKEKATAGYYFCTLGIYAPGVPQSFFNTPNSKNVRRLANYLEVHGYTTRLEHVTFEDRFFLTVSW